MASLFTRAHFAHLRRVMYENTGIDFGLLKSIDEFGERVRKHAALIGELAEPPLSHRKTFTTHPTPNWMHPTPIQGRTKKRKIRDPGSLPSFKSREVEGDVVKFIADEFGYGDNLQVRFPDSQEAYLAQWVNCVLSDGADFAKHAATIDDGTQLFQLTVWPLRFIERGLVQFRYENCTRE